jgi:pimeloyl-[acyl-carrier protein] synthase
MKALRRGLERLLRPIAVRWILFKERHRDGVVWNPIDPSYHQDPYPKYEELRTKAPMHRSELLQGWVITRHKDIDAILRDHRRFSNDPRKGTQPQPVTELNETQSILNLDPPDHTRLRGLVAKAFTPRAVEDLKPRIEEIVDELLDEAEAKANGQPVDIINTLAWPLPATVIAEMLGVPTADREQFKSWSADVARTLEPTITEEEIRQAGASNLKLRDYFEGLIQERRERPREDMISQLIAAEDEGEKLTHDELLVTLQLLLIAGHETTTNLIGNGLLTLLQHPRELAQLRDRGDGIENAVEELIRFDSPVQLDGRTALEDIEWQGETIRKGEQVILLLGAGNRDPDAFPNPNELDLTREQNMHVSFSRGIHHCLGAPLARAEGQITFRRLLDRYPEMSLAEEPTFRDHVVLRGLKSLRVNVASDAAPAEDRVAASAPA